METKAFPSFSEAVEEYVGKLPEEEPEEASKAGAERTRLERTLATQREALLRLKPEIESAQRTAEFIFSNYAEVEKLLREVGEIAKANAKLPGGIEAVDRAKGRFRASLGSTKLMLTWKKDVTGNAQEFYDSVKKLKGKLEGVEGAIKETEGRIKEAMARSLSEQQEKASKTKRKRASAWFERYRWFI